MPFSGFRTERLTMFPNAQMYFTRIRAPATLHPLILILVGWTVLVRPRFVDASWPDEINIGAVVEMGTYAGQQSKCAIDLAVEDVNNDRTILNVTRLRLHTTHIGGGVLADAGEVLEMLNKGVISMVAPQTPEISNFVSFIADSAQIPLVSIAGNDQSIAMKHSAYSIQLVGSDPMQMKAIASVLKSYLWKEIVVIFQDDAFGMSGTMALNDALQEVSANIVHKAAISESSGNTKIKHILTSLINNQTIRSRVFVVHTSYKLGLKLFSEAKSAGMMDQGFVWIVTEWIANFLDTNRGNLKSMEGFIGVRRCIDSNNPALQKIRARYAQKFRARYPDITAHPQMDIVGLCAYDAVWMIARGMDALSRDNRTIDLGWRPSATSLTDLKNFPGGKTLYRAVLNSNFTGISGNINLRGNGVLEVPCYEIVNVVKRDLRVVGNWKIKSLQSGGQPLSSITWPNGSSGKLPSGYRKLIVGVPRKVVFREFINVSYDNISFSGFCIDVFKRTIQNLPYKLDYEFKSYGEGNTTADYDDLVYHVQSKAFDAVVADLAILAERSSRVDFTQPYTDTGLAIMVALKKTRPSEHAWDFLKPFSASMWSTAAAFLVVTAFLVWLLERKDNEDFSGRPAKQMETSLWFSFSTLVFVQREVVTTSLGKSIVAIWLFLVLILNSSYTANLTSILTGQQLTPTIRDTQTLRASTLKVGHLNGSFVRDYLLNDLKIEASRLVPLVEPHEYADFLRNGSVGAIVDETPYINLVMGKYCGEFTIVGQPFHKGGFGFLFTKGFLAVPDITSAMLNITQSRPQIQEIRNKWLHFNLSCANNEEQDNNQLSPQSFWGLFVIATPVYVLCMFGYFGRKFYCLRKNRKVENDPTPSESPSNNNILPESIESHSNSSSFRDDISISSD